MKVPNSPPSLGKEFHNLGCSDALVCSSSNASFGLVPSMNEHCMVLVEVQGLHSKPLDGGGILPGLILMLTNQNFQVIELNHLTTGFQHREPIGFSHGLCTLQKVTRSGNRRQSSNSNVKKQVFPKYTTVPCNHF